MSYAKVETTVTIASDSGYTDNYERRILEAYAVTPTEHLSVRVTAASGTFGGCGLAQMLGNPKFVVLKNTSATIAVIVQATVVSTGTVTTLDLPAGGIMALPYLKATDDLLVKGVSGTADVEVIACS